VKEIAVLKINDDSREGGGVASIIIKHLPMRAYTHTHPAIATSVLSCLHH
jgi:hypothetical protein